MKRILLLFIILLVLFSLCACSEIENEKAYITPNDDIADNYVNYNISGEFVTDINSDGKDDKIVLYTDAELSEDGYNKNDGNNWLLVVFDGSESKSYELFKDYVQLGNVYFQVADYFKDGKPIPTITFYESTGAGLLIMNFTFEEGKGFLKETLFDSAERSEGGINLKYSSIPIY